MEQISTMEKKNQLRAFTVCSKGNQDSKSIDFSSKKNGSQYPRKRDNEKVDSNKKPLCNRGGRPGQRYVRPREKVDKQVESEDSLSEFGSLQRSGGKKQSSTISHLFNNWWSRAPFERVSNRGLSNRGYAGCYSGKKHSIQYPKYNKEHYLQANCQFVVIFGNDYSSYEKNPDQLVEWDYVQEVRLHMSESPSCPICLFSPTAGKVTRCGHIFCYSCILHYLALSDKKWRKCPICFDAITKEDLKSVVTILHKDYGCGEEIEFQLMRRDRDSLIPIPVSQYSTSLMKQVAMLSDASPISRHSKLVVATSEEVTNYIVLRELEDLQKQFKEEESEPESCFIEAAIELVTIRLSSLSDLLNAPKSFEMVDKVNSEEVKDCRPEITNNLQSEGILMELHKKPEHIQTNDEELHYCVGELNLSQNNDRFQSDSYSGSEGISPTDVKRILDTENLDISHFQTSALKNSVEARGPKATYFFYQESGGSNIFLHALNVNMLIKEYGSFENCPQIIKAKVLEKESVSMTEDLRQRLRYLRHLPITCPFEVAEIEIKTPLVSQLTINEFQGQLENRVKKRRKKAKEEHRIEKRVQVEEDKMMGRSRGSSINMTSYKHFPTFAEDPPQSYFEDDFNTSNPNASSPQSSLDEFPAKSPPSFAQIINRPGSRVELKDSFSASSTVAFPTIGVTSDQRNKSLQIKTGRRNKSFGSDDDEDEGEKVPNFQLAFSDAFDRALNEAKIASISAGTNAQTPRGKKGKKKKGIVLLSSGGHH